MVVLGRDAKRAGSSWMGVDGYESIRKIKSVNCRPRTSQPSKSQSRVHTYQSRIIHDSRLSNFTHAARGTRHAKQWWQ